jgi:hypothetical protein
MLVGRATLTVAVAAVEAACQALQTCRAAAIDLVSLMYPSTVCRAKVRHSSRSQQESEGKLSRGELGLPQASYMQYTID